MPKRVAWSPKMIAQAAVRSDNAAESVVAAPRKRGRRKSAGGQPDPVDVHVGSRLRERRLMLGISQTSLGDSLGLTFQQIQKYERGANRVSASMLFRAAEALNVPVSYFFDGLDRNAPSEESEDTRGSRSVLVLTRAINKLDPVVRDRVANLVTALADTRPADKA